MTGLSFDLPTEAQWEYACRAGTTSAYNNGSPCTTGESIDSVVDQNLEPLAYYGGNWNWKAEDGDEKRIIGSKEPNQWGLYDMHGQIWEYCLDWYENFFAEDKVWDPPGPKRGKNRVSRGGSWHAWPSLCRSAGRHFERGRFWAQGFRVICRTEQLDKKALYMVVDLSTVMEGKYTVSFYHERPGDLEKNPQYKKTHLVLRRVPAGNFLMGSPENEVGRDPDETLHRVHITADYYIGIYPVSQGQWECVMGAQPSAGEKNQSYPVESVTWDEVRGGFWPVNLQLEGGKSQSLCSELTAKTGLSFDLPTEAQWEYACRAGTNSAYYNGTECQNGERGENQQDKNLEEIAWYGGNWNFELQSKDPQRRRVGQKEPNQWGLYDMHGQVWEYCLDWYAPYSQHDLVDPKGPLSGQKRVVRGGSWHAWPAANRSATRSQSRGAFGAQGVRIVCSIGGDVGDEEYMIVDISKGSNSDTFPFLFQNHPPQDLRMNDVYRTTKMILRRIPAGNFLMGSPEDELGRSEDEVQHRVTLTREYFIGIYPLTQAQWQLIMGYNNSVFFGEMLPIDSIDWEECRSGSWPPEEK